MQKKPTRRRIWLAIGAGILIVIILGWFVDLGEVVAILRDTDWVILSAAAGVFVLGILFVAIRLRYILDKRVDFLPVLHTDGVSYTGKFFTPVPLPIIRIIVLSLITPIDVSESSPGIVVDRLIDSIMRLVALVLTLLLASNAPPSFGIILGGIISVILILWLTTWLVRNINSILPKFASLAARLPNITEESVQGAFANLQTGLGQVQSTRKLIVAMLISLIMWTCFTSFYALGFPALRLGVDLREAFTLAAAAMVFVPPSSPPMIGVYQGIMVAIMLPFGYLDSSEITAYAIIIFMVQLVIWLVLAIWGLRRAQLNINVIIKEISQGRFGLELDESTGNHHKK